MMMDSKIGQKKRTTHMFIQADFDTFAELSGDDNPIHVDPEFSARTSLGRTAAHGMLLYGVICGFLSRTYPGAVQLSQQFMFPAPTFTGEELIIQSEVLEVLREERSARLATTITDPRGQLTCDGQTDLFWPGENDT